MQTVEKDTNNNIKGIKNNLNRILSYIVLRLILKSIIIMDPLKYNIIINLMENVIFMLRYKLIYIYIIMLILQC